ncbi:hypothetical protein PTSG_12752 [Salpingoeca rosetta]|uniref:Uncharacterized protein n=1 Tax=Salpingoeca rosetta (strain ATCC 50818 / BSB-021) TaxID=946362 RepID=F2UJZ3_SALR5|nr:uncharacterized protein PTSG_12752 [Salpingoeca rosetta]EGD77442.1 hypothetical protein PTSG_12752 [Salpingoeca rosetta]|eukprot:XP_004990330.1 hypothetical protein PTSG_12752 [Salpingoeca rosetta]
MPAVTVKTQTRDEVPQSTRLVDVGHRQRSANMVSTRRNNWSELRRYLQNFQGQRIVDQFRACSRNEKVIIVGALAQATIVALLQALILALEKLPDLDSSRRSYIFFFFFVCCAGLVQAVFGILTTSLTELSTVLLLNVLSVIYASLQVSELWSDNVDPNSTVVVLAAISCAVLAIIVLVDAVVLAHLYETFAEAVYSRIGSDAAIQSMYHSFKAMGAVSTLLTILNT